MKSATECVCVEISNSLPVRVMSGPVQASPDFYPEHSHMAFEAMWHLCNMYAGDEHHFLRSLSPSKDGLEPI